MDSFLEKAASYVLAPYESPEAFLSAASGTLTALIDLNSKTGWLYLMTSVLVAAIIYAWRKRAESTRSVSLTKFLFPRDVYLNRSAIVDYKFVAIDLTVKAFLYSPLIAGFSWLVSKGTAGFVAGVWVGLSPEAALVSTIAVPILVLVMADFGFFFSHYLMHKIRVLWYFHEIHHSAEVLTPVTVYRTHPVEDLVNGIVAGFLGGIGAATYASATGNEVTLPMILGVNIVQFLFFSFAFQLRHSHIWLSYGPVFSWIFISPAQHQIHHSTDPKHWDKNFGFTLAIWDVIFGSLYVPKQRETLHFGLPNADPRDFATVPRLYFLPFAKASRCVQSSLRQWLYDGTVKRS